LEGSQISYAKFNPWKPCSTNVSTLSLDFKTDHPQGLLLYADDVIKGDFIEVKLLAGSLRLRLKSVVITEGSGLGDGLWHHLEIAKDSAGVSIIVDTIRQSRSYHGDDLPNSNKSSFMYVGGIPIGFSAKLSVLSLPSVVFEPRLRGSVRNLFYSNCGEDPTRAVMVDNVGVRTNDRQSCLQRNPCLNQGSCIPTDTGSICDCSGTKYEGQFCQHVRIPPQATFFGREQLSYQLSTIGDPIISARDNIEVHFKSRQANGLLFFTGTRTDYLQVSLSEGGLSVLVVLGSGSTEIEVKPRRRFDDNRWHHVIITRDAREVSECHLYSLHHALPVSVVVNNHWEKTGTATGSFTMLTSDLLFVGGPPDDGSALSSRLAPSFRGCLKEVLYTADSIRLDLLNLARNQHDLLKVTGDLLFDQCEDLAESQPITFLTEESFLESVTWDLSKGGSLSLKFRTNEPNGLLVYSLGAPLSGVYFAVEILDDLLYVTVVTESGLIQKIPAIHGSSVSDGNPHDLRIKINGSLIVVSVDQRRTRVDLSGHSSELSFVTPLVFGGLSPMSAQHAPIQMWSAMLGYGYVGCLQDVEVNGLKIVLADLARDQQAEGVVEYCRTEPAECPDYPCMHRGKCRDGWNRYVCDCTATAYSGESCNDVAVSLGFDGSQFMEIPLPEESTSEVEDISLRFRTERADGLLFATLSNSSVDRLEVMLDAGQLRMDINLGTGTKTLLAGSNLDNSAWHWLQIRRRAGQIELQVDNETTVKGTFMRSGAKFIDFDQLRLAKRPTRDVSHLRSKRNFIGDMSQFLFNKNDFFEMARAGGIENLRTNARIDKREALVNSPITFLSPAAYLTTKLKLYSTFTIYFSLKTTQPDGLIMYSGSGITGKDFLTIEMVNGHLRYVYDVGSGPRVVRSKYKGPLNDNDWHHVAILRPTLNQHILRVDDTAAHDHLPNFSSVHFDMGDHFYVGGLDKTMYDSLPKQVKSREGFLGCVASLDLDGNQNIMEHRANIPDEFRDAVSSGCEGPTTQCTDTSCDNGGLCVQEWNTYSCECDRTSFTGPTCSDDGIAYTFEGGGGLIAYTFPEDDQPSTKRDVISLGFSTAQKDAVLVRVNGATNDYIEMELVDGNIFVVYNMGTMDHPIGELFERVNDDQYHVVRFTRNGPNSTIQIDDLQVQTKTPTGRHMNVFNNQATVHIGGKKSSGQLMRPFKGTIAGLVLNGEKILELAAEGDPSVKIEGDVELEIKPLRRENQIVTTTPQGEGPGDDIVFSGVESGCHFEDEEECVHGSGASTQDALIRPV
ncbi:hypothetical protein CAPTEDRAFT_22004, partial [Capitella teleta]